VFLCLVWVQFIEPQAHEMLPPSPSPQTALKWHHLFPRWTQALSLAAGPFLGWESKLRKIPVSHMNC
jgi:hypothetical protein